MLAEAAVVDPVESDNKPLKRRRLLREVSIPSYDSPRNGKGKQPVRSVDGGNVGKGQAINFALPTGLQTIDRSSGSDEEDEDDFAFEDVDLNQRTEKHESQHQQSDGIEDLSIKLDQQVTPAKRAAIRRKPASAAEKAVRLLVHKSHALCLLSHCIYINSWCNNEVVQRNLTAVLPVKTKGLLNPKATDSQFVRHRAFNDGLEQATELFKLAFTVNASGMQRAKWNDDDSGGKTDQAVLDPVDRSDFMRASKKLEGSQDTGNQLFCALLRSAGVQARLVCSLQPLPFTTSTTKTNTPQKKPPKPIILAIASDTDPDKTEASASDTSITASRTIGKVLSARRRLGQPSFASPSASTPAPPPRQNKKDVRKLAYPIFWTEAFDAAHQKWLPVDPIVTGTTAKASKFEPPAAYEFNQLSYAVAFESDAVAKDVTKRYAKAFNAKTRRQRVEATGDEGVRWWRKVMRFFHRRGIALDREQVEDAELAKKEAREGLPGNVQDFKGHPYYALERYLKRHEVIAPRREVGKVNAGTAARPRMEFVFRRQDVLACRSADKWYRLGRVVKEREQPLKHVVSRSVGRRARSPSVDQEGDDEKESGTTALYAFHQTEVYVPPPVVKGKVPRNAFKNLDIYTPSMVPSGGTHIRHALTQEAARYLHVDFADAVTGFQFKGRQGTAVVEGAVVPSVYAEAVGAVIEGLEWEAELGVSRQRSLQALRLWKRFLTGLRIAERVSSYGDGSSTDNGKGKAKEPDGDDGEKQRLQETAEAAPLDGGVELPTAGQFSLDELTSATKRRVPPKRKRAVEESDEDDVLDEESDGEDQDGDLGDNPDADYGGGGFFPDAEGAADLVAQPSAGGQGGYLADDDAHGNGDGGGGFLVPDDGEGGERVGEGGFLVAEMEGDGGGFVPEGVEDGMDGVLGDTAASVSNARDSRQEDHVLHVGDRSQPDASRTHGPDNQHPPPNTVHDHPTESNMAMSDSSARDALEPPASEATMSNTGLHNNITHGLPEPDDLHQNNDHHTEEREAEQQSDRGSLMSHDPEDEDAEPDWMESD